MQVVLSERAACDIEKIIQSTRDRFGWSAAKRYGELITQALVDLSRNSLTEPVAAELGLPEGFGAAHLFRSRTNVPTASRVKSPRHYLLFQLFSDHVLVVRVIHDRSDISDAALEMIDPPIK